MDAICQLYHDNAAVLSGFISPRQVIHLNEAVDAYLSKPWDWDKRNKLQNSSLEALRAVAPSKLAAVVMTCRDEGVYLLEWIAHYLAQGVEGIFIYANDCVDGSPDLLRKLADYGVITFIENKTNEQANPQRKAHEHAIKFLPELRQYQWVGFLDADEFYVGARLPALLATSPSTVGAVWMGWRWYGSAGEIQYQDAPLANRFRYARPSDTGKSFCRLKSLRHMGALHVPVIEPSYKITDSGFNELQPNHFLISHYQNYDKPYLAHFWNKSFEEFLVKQSRGNYIGARSVWARQAKNFFDWDVPMTSEFWAPIPEYLTHLVRHQMMRLLALPGVAERAQNVRIRFADLRRKVIDQQGGLELVYATTKVHRD